MKTKKALRKSEQSSTEKLSKKELKLREIAEEAIRIAKKYNMRPFNRAEIYTR